MLYTSMYTMLHDRVLREEAEEMNAKPKRGTEKDKGVRLNARTAGKQQLSVHVLR